MGRYISQSDIEAVFGADNVAGWSNLDNAQAAADEARVAAAIAHAEAVVDDRFRGGPYAVPLRGAGGTPRAVIDWAARLAGIRLWEARGLAAAGEAGDPMAAMRQGVHAEIDQYLSGRRRLDALPAGEAPTGPVVV